MTTQELTASPQSLGKSYAAVAAIIGACVTWICVTTAGQPASVPERTLVHPMFALFVVTFLVWLVTLLVRNISVIRGTVSMRYFAAYSQDIPDERLERPARTFNNLMQVPTLFYVVCILMMLTHQVDSAQLTLAWTFVALRALHALVYILLNFVPYRFAVWVSSFVTLCVLWVRFVVHLP